MRTDNVFTLSTSCSPFTGRGYHITMGLVSPYWGIASRMILDFSPPVPLLSTTTPPPATIAKPRIAVIIRFLLFDFGALMATLSITSRLGKKLLIIRFCLRPFLCVANVGNDIGQLLIFYIGDRAV